MLSVVTLSHFTECCCADAVVLSAVMNSVIELSVVLLCLPVVLFACCAVCLLCCLHVVLFACCAQCCTEYRYA